MQPGTRRRNPVRTRNRPNINSENSRRRRRRRQAEDEAEVVDNNQLVEEEEEDKTDFYRVILRVTGNPRTPVQGMLLRAQEGVQGRFIIWNEHQFLDPEGSGECLTHLTEESKRRMPFVFEVPAGSPPPTFRGVVYRTHRGQQQWWKFEQ